MSDNKKYYYIKLKDNYFDQDNIKLLEAQPNGYIYSLILLKLYLRAASHDGRLMMTQSIPYDPSNIDVLSKVIGHDVDHVKQALRSAIELDIITVVGGKELWMTEIQNMIGKSSTEAERKRIYRQHLKELDGGKVVSGYIGQNEETDNRPPELEIELETEIKIDKKHAPKSKAGTKHETGVPINNTTYQSLIEDYGKATTDRYIQKAIDYCDASGKSYYKDFAAAARNYISRAEEKGAQLRRVKVKRPERVYGGLPDASE